MDWLYGILRNQRQARVGQLEHNLRQARRSRRQRRRRVWALEQQVGELRLVSLAMFELLMERAPVSNEELIAKIEEIDIRDGTADGRTREAVARGRCPRCDRILLRSLRACLYCSPQDDTGPLGTSDPATP